MVTFTCEKCNESLKKNAVSKHLWRCKSHSFTCIDCQQNFDNQTFNTHVKCMTEEQRYQGKLYVPKGSQDKNQKKQDSWVDNIQRYIDQGHGGLEARFLSQIAEHPNVPRKKPKFANFVKTVLKMHDPQKIDAIWTHVTKANEDTKAKDNEDNGKAAPQVASNEPASANSDGSKEVDKSAENGTLNEPAKKKRKKEPVTSGDEQAEQQTDANGNQNGDENNDNNKVDSTQQEKKGKKRPRKEKKEKLPKYRWKSQITSILNEMGPMTLRKLQSRLYIRYKKHFDVEKQEDKETVYARIAQATEKSSKVTFTPENNMVTLNKSVDREES